MGAGRNADPTSFAYSNAVAFVSMSTPALATQYGSMVLEGAMPPSDDTFTMHPSVFLRWGSTACTQMSHRAVAMSQTDKAMIRCSPQEHGALLVSQHDRAENSAAQGRVSL